MGEDAPRARVDHVGIAVEDVESAEPLLTALGCRRLVDDVVEDRFRWVYYELGGGSRIELIEPVAEESFLTDYLDRHGPGLHHVTIEVADIDAMTATLEAAGFEIVDRAAYDEWIEAFVSPRNPTGTLFQLMEYTARYGENGEHTAADLVVGDRRLSTE
ncbi:methylmalonyl-CoA epimerase [Halopenitus malekzadehii]|uniref:Methylmalonyl-CoA epimerase n=1 Tax=Halopenitus malekzadehii TaxID=1267564 RepID=A0A1H6HSV7_9EURY|nr:VOC family protein [Halopenitus malekzadehii]SEH37235.1 methylmalonyl-CoA epimerase [Halopenitus malekzadehii]